MMPNRPCPAKTITLSPKGSVTPPPSKSYGHRAIICAALAARCGNGGSVVENIVLSGDIAATLEGIKSLGCRWTFQNGTLRIDSWRDSEEPTVDCGESGSTLRFLLPVAALGAGAATFTGKGRLMRRPLETYEPVFRQADVRFAHDGARAQVQGRLRSGVYTLPGDVSSQFVTGLLLTLPLVEGNSEIRLSTPLESRGYVDMTIAVMERFGVSVEQHADRYRVRGGQRYRAARYPVEGDYSQAAYFLGAAALGRDVWCVGLNRQSLQGDKAILDILRQMGAEIVEKNERISARAAHLQAITADARQIPDIIPPVAVLCCFCRGESRIINAGRLRLKESDRLHALAVELAKLGARVSEGEDSLTIRGTDFLRGGRVDAHNDHRIAMSMALASLRCEKPVELTGADSVNKSYPNFWNDFEKEAGAIWQTHGGQE